MLVALTGGTPKTGRAFTVSWPWVDAGGTALGPALPVAVTAHESSGPDGAYRREGDCVFREAGGRERSLIAATAAGDVASSGFEILWFGEAARFLVHQGALEVEDLFSRMTAPAPRPYLEQWLIRRLRCQPAILAYLSAPETAAQETTIEISRGQAVTAGTWNDPQAFFRKGIGFETVTMRGNTVVAHGRGRQRVEYALSGCGGGWRATLVAGAAPFESLSVVRDGQEIVLTATIAAAIDPLASGKRERLAFDLRSFLVAL